jgi:hypothetical protein
MAYALSWAVADGGGVVLGPIPGVQTLQQLLMYLTPAAMRRDVQLGCLAMLLFLRN